MACRPTTFVLLLLLPPMLMAGNCGADTDTWPDTDTDTRLVFITQGIAPAWAERLLDALVWESRDITKRLATQQRAAS